MDNWFYFLQNGNGEIVAVNYPEDETSEIVNIKKNIASTFQANYAETDTQEEVDSQSSHTSHYRYYYV